MRHGKSDWSTGLDDFDRPLSKRGHNDAPAMGEWLADNDLVPTTIVTSAAARAFATAAHVAEVVGFDPASMEARDDLYLASAHRWLEVIGERDDDERLLICGHNPGLDDFVEYLSADPLTYTDDHKLMTTAAIAVFEIERWGSLDARSVPLLHLIRPKELD